MKNLLLYLSTLLSSFSYSQKDFSKDVLIGTWKFIELQDEKGIKHTEIPMYFQGQETVELINRDDYIFFKNGTINTLTNMLLEEINGILTKVIIPLNLV